MESNYINKEDNWGYLIFVGSNSNRLYKYNYEFVKAINTIQKSWTATRYIEYETLTLRDMMTRGGGRKIPR